MDYKISTEYDGKPRKLFSKKCIVCGNEFWTPKHMFLKRKSCSRKCGKKSRSIRITCAWCKKEIWRAPCKIKKFMFCSRDCKELAQSIEGGEAFSTMRPYHYKDGLSAYQKRAKKVYGKKCNRCGYSKNEAALQAHHVDYDRSNNSIENLEILCANCHAIETWG